MKKRGKYIPCEICGLIIYRLPFHIKKNKHFFCSSKCHNLFLGRNKKKIICKYCGKTIYKSNSMIKKSNFCSDKCLRLFNQKENHPRWIQDRSKVKDLNTTIRTSKAWKKWREVVFERDKYICQLCGAINGNGYRVELHPHHIKSFKDYPNLRFDISNGITLCISCHNKIHTQEAYTPVNIFYARNVAHFIKYYFGKVNIRLWKKYGVYSPHIIIRQFGSWSNFKNNIIGHKTESFIY